MINKRLLPSSEEMSHFDAVTIAQGVSSQTLMERAGNGMADVLEKGISLNKGHFITCLCGPGNNGGDGLVIARLLHKKGFNVHTIVASSTKFSPDNTVEQKLYTESGGKLSFFSDKEKSLDSTLSYDQVFESLSKSHTIVDALLGVNQKYPPRGNIKELVLLVEEVKASNPDIKVFAVDIPTGVCGTSGEVFTPHISADITATVQFKKRGMVQGAAKDVSGEINIIDIGISADKDTEFLLLSPELDACIPTRSNNAHKGSYGSVFVVGGCKEMPGAPILSALSALRAGAGTVTKTSHSESLAHMFSPEIMHCMLPSEHDCVQESDLEKILQHIEKSSVIAVGPGLSQQKEVTSVVKKIIESASHKNIPFVLDADALNALSTLSFEDEIYSLLGNSIVTPHPGEMARLLKTTIQEVERDRYGAAKSFTLKTRGVVVLKGSATIISTRDKGRVFTDGTPYLATAGSGDVLTGIIASFVGQGVSLFEAACTGVLIHSEAAQHALDIKKGPIIASDIIASLPSVIGIHL